MTLTITRIAARPDHKGAWPVFLRSGGGEERGLMLPGEQAPGWADVADYLAALPEGHALADAHLEYRVTNGAFAARFPRDTFLDILDAEKGRGVWADDSDPRVRNQRIAASQAVQQAQLRAYVDVAHSDTEEFVDGLISAGLLAPGAKADVLAPVLAS